jgi:cell division GTPase FtsZ
VSVADVEGAKGLAFGKGTGATPVVVDELEEGGALAVIEIGLV